MNLKRRPLNILQVASGFAGWGGTEWHLLRLSDHLARRGHAVTVVCQPDCFIETQARKRGLVTAQATVERPWDWQDKRKFISLMRAQRFDVVHVHGPDDQLVPPTVARLCQVPFVVMSYHLPYPLLPYWRNVLHQKHLFRRIIAVSDSVRRTLLAQGLPPRKVCTIHNAVDVEAVGTLTETSEAIRKGWGVPDGAVVAGLVGHLIPEKGIFIFLQALALCLPLPLHGVLIGDGDGEKEARRMAHSLGLDGRVTFAGFRADANNAINALDIHVLASVWPEPCATVVMEAMALSKAVIGTNIGGTPEIIVSDMTGLLVPPSDAKALADALRCLILDAPGRIQMGLRGRATVQKHFSVTQMTEKIESLYCQFVR